jgi:hypothetical protein
MTQEQHKDLALITCIIIQEDILGGTVFQTFDKAYDIAIKFQEIFPEDKDWEGIYPNFDEAVIDFCYRHQMNGYERLKQIYKR